MNGKSQSDAAGDDPSRPGGAPTPAAFGRPERFRVVAGSARIGADGPPAAPGGAPLLRRTDQLVLAAAAAMALAAMIGYWAIRGGFSGGLIELERADSIPTQFWVDLNQADWAELAQIPGVGESLARRIVESRDSAGPFVDHEDLQRIRGIGPRTLETMRPFLRPLPPAANVAGP